jgi:hypothetical protein
MKPLLKMGKITNSSSSMHPLTEAPQLLTGYLLLPACGCGHSGRAHHRHPFGSSRGHLDLIVPILSTSSVPKINLWC